MKLIITLLLPIVVSAFVPSTNFNNRIPAPSRCKLAVKGERSREPASSKKEDLELTLQIIRENLGLGGDDGDVCENTESADGDALMRNYQVALQAANEKVTLLNSQIESLEAEIASLTAKMNKSINDSEDMEDKYTSQKKLYDDLKIKASAANAEYEAASNLLKEEITGYRSQISTLESELDRSQSEVSNWKDKSDLLQSELVELSNRSDKLKKEVDELHSALASKRQQAQEQVKPDIEEKIRAEIQDEARRRLAATVDELREQMNSEVRTLKAAMKKMLLDRTREEFDNKQLIEDIEALRKELEEEQAQSTKKSQEYNASLETYSSEQYALNMQLVEKDLAIEKLEEMVSKLTANVDKENKLRQEAIMQGNDIKSELQKKIDDMTIEIDNTNANANTIIASKEEDQKREVGLKEDAIQMNAKLQEENAAIKADAEKKIAAQSADIKKMEQIIEGLRANISELTKARGEVSNGRWWQEYPKRR